MINLNKILTESDLYHFLSYMIDKLGWDFHPDDPICDYIKEDGTLLFDVEQVVVLERLMDESFEFCEQNEIDIYNLSMSICIDKYGDIFEELHKVNLVQNGK